MDMGGGGGHDMGGMMAPPPSPPGMGKMRMRYTHMTFFWGTKSEILFTGWPGANAGMYALALAAVFALAFLLEFLGSRRLDWLLPAAAAAAAGRGDRRRVAAGASRAAVHAVRVGGSYLLMLALMSFNGGVLLVEDGFDKGQPAPAACC
nr:unnamed protein product [Digitaria exilis]